MSTLRTNTLRTLDDLTIVNVEDISSAITRVGEVANVKSFGAVGDGVADDTAAIQATIDSLTSGGLIYYPTGIYKISGQLTCKSNTTHYGPSATINQTTNNTALFYGSGLINVEFRKLKLNGVGFSDTALTTNAASYSSSARAFGIWMETCINVKVRDCTLTNFLNAAIVPAYCTDVWLVDNVTVGTYQGLGDVKTPPGDGNFQAFGIWVYAGSEAAVPVGAGNIHIVGNKCNTVAHAIFVGPGYNYVVVKDNIVGNTAQHGFYLNPGSNLIVCGNHSEPYLDGIKVQTTGAVVNTNPTNINIFGNTCSGSTVSGNGINIDIIAPSGSSDKTNFINQNVNVANNTISNWVGTGINAKQCVGSSIHGNVLSSIDGTGIIARHFGGSVSNNQFYSVSKEVVISQPSSGRTLFVLDNTANTAATKSPAVDGYFTALAAEDPITWVGSTAFGLGVRCVNGANVYEVVDDGTSAASGGPTGTGSAIVDGTITWAFVSTFAGIDRGSLDLIGNHVTPSPASDQPSYSVLAGASALKFRWARNILPRIKTLTAAQLQVSIGATILMDEGNIHGGFDTPVLPTGAAPAFGSGKREFFSNSIPTAGGPYVVGDVCWNTTPIAGSFIGWVCTALGSPGTWLPFGHVPFVTTGVFDFPSVATGASTTVAFAASGAVLGDIVDASFSLSLQGLTLSAYVSAADSVTAVLSNNTGAPVNLASGTLKFSITKTS